jgi:perosamine synthetase
MSKRKLPKKQRPSFLSISEEIIVAKERGIVVIEDAAQAVGSDHFGVADFTCVSLQAIKTLTSGDGGFLICKSKKHFEKAKRLRWFGYDREKKQRLGDTDLVDAGYKYHMNDITAAIGRGNLQTLDKVIAYRRKLQQRYIKNGCRAYPWFGFTLRGSLKIKEELKKSGYESGQHHYRNDKYTLFGGKQRFPIMDELEDKFLLLPLHHKVTLNDVDKICKVIDKNA